METVTANRAFLCGQSKVLADLFSQDQVQGQGHIFHVTLAGVRAYNLQRMLELMMTGTTVCNFEVLALLDLFGIYVDKGAIEVIKEDPEEVEMPKIVEVASQREMILDESDVEFIDIKTEYGQETLDGEQSDYDNLKDVESAQDEEEDNPKEECIKRKKPRRYLAPFLQVYAPTLPNYDPCDDVQPLSLTRVKVSDAKSIMKLPEGGRQRLLKFVKVYEEQTITSIVCPYCPKVFDGHKKVKNHVFRHFSERVIERRIKNKEEGNFCFQCGKTYVRLDDLIFHDIMRHNSLADVMPKILQLCLFSRKRKHT